MRKNGRNPRHPACGAGRAPQPLPRPPADLPTSVLGRPGSNPGSGGCLSGTRIEFRRYVGLWRVTLEPSHPVDPALLAVGGVCCSSASSMECLVRCAARKRHRSDPSPTNTADASLNPTAHPAVPPTLEAMWYARGPPHRPRPDCRLRPRRSDVRRRPYAAAVACRSSAHQRWRKSDLSDYSRYFTGFALQRLDRLDEANSMFATVVERSPVGQLPESALYRRAEIRQTRSDFAGAAAIYQQLVDRKSRRRRLRWCDWDDGHGGQ